MKHERVVLACRTELDMAGCNRGVDGYEWVVAGGKGQLGGLEVLAGCRDLVDGGFRVMGCHSGWNPGPLPRWCFALRVWRHLLWVFAKGVVVNDVIFTNLFAL